MLGIHSYSNIHLAKRSWLNTGYSRGLLKCTIPEGAMYMKNKDGEMISDYLIIGTKKDFVII